MAVIAQWTNFSRRKNLAIVLGLVGGDMPNAIDGSAMSLKSAHLMPI